MVKSIYIAGVSIPGMMTWFYTVWRALWGDLGRYVTVVLEYRRVKRDIYRGRFGKSS